MGTRPTPVFLVILDFEGECVSFWFRVIWFSVSKRVGSSEVRANAGQRPLRTRRDTRRRLTGRGQISAGFSVGAKCDLCPASV